MGFHLSRRSTTPAFRLALAACLALVLGGCTIYAGRVTHYSPAPAVVQSNVDCVRSIDESWPNGPESPPPSPALAGSVPAGFMPEKVFICRPSGVSANGADMRLVQQEELAGDFTALLAALAEPSDRGEANVACPAMMELSLGLWLVNAAGDAVQITWPTDTCGMTFGKPATQKAIDALTVVDTRVIQVPEQGK